MMDHILPRIRKFLKSPKAKTTIRNPRNDGLLTEINRYEPVISEKHFAPGGPTLVAVELEVGGECRVVVNVE